MILSQSLRMDLASEYVGKVIRIHEGTTTGAEKLVVSVFNNDVPFTLTGYTAKYDATIATFLAEENATATISGNTVTIPITSNMTAKSGTLAIDVKIINGNEVLFIKTIYAIVDRKVIGEDTIIDVSGATIVGRLNELSDDIEDLETSLQGVQGDIGSLETSLQGVQGDIEDIETSYMKLSKDVPSAEIENLPQGQMFSNAGGYQQAIKTQDGYQEFVLGNRVSTIRNSPTNAQIPTALAVKNYADGVVVNCRPVVTTALLSYNLWNNNQQTIRGVSDLVTPNTQANVQIDQNAYEILKSNGVERLWVTNDGDSTNPTLTAHIIGDTPAESFAVQLTLTEVRAE